MEQERWPRLEELLHEALDRAPEQRQEFLDAACRGDANLRRELESLLALEHQAGSFLEKPALEDATVTLAMHPGPTVRALPDCVPSRGGRHGQRLPGER